MVDEIEEQLESEAVALFNCDKSILNYLVSSAGSIGPSKLIYTKKKIES